MHATTLSPSINSQSYSSQSTLCSYSSPVLARSFSSVSIGHLRFIIMDCPTPENLEAFALELKVRGVFKVIRLCKPSYDASFLSSSVGITVHDLPFPDGGTPPPSVISSFLALVEKQFGSLPNSLSKDTIQSHRVIIHDHAPVIAVHCVAGLGRAPLLVAIALIEAGFVPIDAVGFIRQCRRGAFNALQLRYLMDLYKKRPVSRLPITAAGFANFLKRAPSPLKECQGETRKPDLVAADTDDALRVKMQDREIPNVKQSFFKKIFQMTGKNKLEVSSS